MPLHSPGERVLRCTGLSVDRSVSKVDMKDDLSPALSSDPTLMKQNSGNDFSAPSSGEHN